MSIADIAHTLRDVHSRHRKVPCSHNSTSPTPRNPTQETANSVQFVPVMRFLVFDFGVYATRMFLTQHMPQVTMNGGDVWHVLDQALVRYKLLCRHYLLCGTDLGRVPTRLGTPRSTIPSDKALRLYDVTPRTGPQVCSASRECPEIRVTIRSFLRFELGFKREGTRSMRRAVFASGHVMRVTCGLHGAERQRGARAGGATGGGHEDHGVRRVLLDFLQRQALQQHAVQLRVRHQRDPRVRQRRIRLRHRPHLHHAQVNAALQNQMQAAACS
eukprot:482615-Rhodomonas_salina.1